MSTRKISIRDICYIGAFTALIAVCAQISIPMPYGVPITLQTFAVALAGVVLGAKKGAVATLVYVLLGTIGVPVFANFTGGVSIVLGPSGGFILSFPLMAIFAGIGECKGNKIYLVCGIIAGVIINYLCGVLYFTVIMSSDLKTAFIACVLPFIPADIGKIVLVAILGRGIKKVLLKSGVMI